MTNQHLAKKPFAYSYFESMLQLIPSGPTYKVLQMLINELIKSQRIGVHVITLNKIEMANIAGVTRKHIGTYLNNLFNMRFIEETKRGGFIRINLSTIYGVVRAFEKINDTTAKRLFIKALHSGDYSALESLGYVESPCNTWIHSLLSTSISAFTDNELIDELRKREYSGELIIQTKIQL